MYRLIALLVGYLFGCLQTGYFLSKQTAGIDIRRHGSGNAGMTNVTRVLGFRKGWIVLVADIAKAVLAFLLAHWWLGGTAGLYAGVGVVLGHNFPAYLGFKGGKGVASTLGIVAMLDWRAALIIYALMLVIVIVTRYISATSLSMSVLIPLMLAIFGHGWETVAVTTWLGVLAWYMHRENIGRLLAGKESRFSFGGSKKPQPPPPAAEAFTPPPADPTEPVLPPNENKALEMNINGIIYDRYPVVTHVITKDDTLETAFVAYLQPHVRQQDIVFISERAVACTQARAIRMVDIQPRKLAVFLSRHVQKTPHGIGLGIPETMEMALRECGTLRILFAAAVSVIGKLFGRRGWFYRIAGEKARGIDGPCENTLPPYNEYVVLTPQAPTEAAQFLARRLGVAVAIVDANDLGCNLLGVSDPAITEPFIAAALRDNPLGQSGEQTPCGIIREYKG